MDDAVSDPAGSCPETPVDECFDFYWFLAELTDEPTPCEKAEAKKEELIEEKTGKPAKTEEEKEKEKE